MAQNNQTNSRYSIQDCKASIDKNNPNKRYNHSIKEYDQSLRAEKK